MDDHNEEQMEEAYDEGELSDDNFESLSYDDLLDRVESNDPSLTSVKISTRILIPNDDDDRQRRLVERLSTAIGRNTQLKALMFDNFFDGWLFDPKQLDEAHPMDLFSDIARNQSIKRFYFKGCEASSVGNACRILTPLFKRNQVERVRIDNCKLSTDSTRLLATPKRMVIHCCTLSIEGIGLIATSLAEFDSLKEFVLTDVEFHHYYQQAARDLMQALSGHSRLRKLNLSSTEVGKLGCSALVDLLSNPNMSLRVLDLTSNYLGDDEAVALSSGMAGNISMKEINLAGNRGITQAGWQALFNALSSSRCRLEMITLKCNNIDDAVAQSLSNALTSSTTLKTLDLGFNWSITIAGWRVLFLSLRSPTCPLEDLALSDTRNNDEMMTSLIDALANNRLLKSLNLFSNTRVTGAGWQRFFSTVLANPSSGLEKLYLCRCHGIDDTTIRALTDALVNNSKLKVLDLSHNQVANAGWEVFSSVLESPHTALEELDLQGDDINDATCTALLNSLAGNKKLKKLVFDHSAAWEPNLGVLCNAASITDTYNSNHTLEKLGDLDEDEWPEEFESLLQINRENSPNQAARIKIIKTHFNAGFITQPFVGMDLNVLPHAMAWMGRDGRAGEVDGHYFSFIKSISSLFENAN